MGFCFQRDNRFDFLYFVEVRFVTACRSELFDHRAFVESYIIFIGGDQFVRVFRRCFLNQVKERTFFLFSVDNKCSAEDFVTAVFRVHLCKTVHFAVCQPSFQLLAYFVEVSYFFIAQCQSFLFIVGFDILDVNNWVRLFADREDVLVQTVIDTLQHRVMFCFAGRNREVFLDA